VILYANDYTDQRCYVHLNTKNISALRIAKLLKEMGIKNNKFMLAITQKELFDIDPHNLKDSSSELKARITLECKINPWYYLREIIRVPASGVLDGIPYEFNRGNLCLTWVTYNSVNIMIVMPRQVGKSIGTQSIVSQLMYVSGTNYNTGAFAKDDSLRQQNVIRLKEMKESIPNYILLPSTADTDNKEGLSYKALNNSYKTFIAQKDPRAAAKQARGETFPFEHWDESAWYDNIWESFPSATSAMSAARDQALKMNLPSAIVQTTTSGRVDDKRGKWAYDYGMSGLKFNEMLYDCVDKAHLQSLVEENSTNGSIYAEFNYKQLGKSEAWFRKNTESISNQDIIDMDYNNIWLVGKSGSVLPTELLNKLLQIEPLFYTQSDSIFVRWYIDQKTRYSEDFKMKTLIAGIDISDNVGIDFTTLTIVDPTNLSTVATFRSNSSNITLFVFLVASLMEEFPQLLINPERNRNGGLFIDNLIIVLRNKRINFTKRIFNTFIQEYDSSSMRSIDDLNYDGVDRKYLGFKTSRETRETLYSSILFIAVNSAFDRIYDVNIISELKSLISKNGRIDHDKDGHDDQVISWLLAMFVIFNGKNLSMYDIDTHLILSAVDRSGKSIDPAYKKEQMAISDRIKEIERILPNSTSYIRHVLESELIELKDRLDLDIDLYEGTVSRLQIEEGVDREEKITDNKIFENSMSVFNNFVNQFYHS